MALELLSPGTAQSTPAELARTFKVNPNNTATAQIIGSAGAGDKIHIQYTPDNGVNWYNLKEEGLERDLDFNNNVQLIRGPLLGRFNRPSGNAASIGAALSTRSNP